jgi:flagellar motor switch protein FliM
MKRKEENKPVFFKSVNVKNMKTHCGMAQIVDKGEITITCRMGICFGFILEKK